MYPSTARRLERWLGDVARMRGPTLLGLRWRDGLVVEEMLLSLSLDLGTWVQLVVEGRPEAWAPLEEFHLEYLSAMLRYRGGCEVRMCELLSGDVLVLVRPRFATRRLCRRDGSRRRRRKRRRF